MKKTERTTRSTPCRRKSLHSAGSGALVAGGLLKLGAKLGGTVSEVQVDTNDTYCMFNGNICSPLGRKTLSIIVMKPNLEGEINYV